MAREGTDGGRWGRKRFFPALLGMLMVMILALVLTPAAEVKAAYSASYRQASWDAANKKVTYETKTMPAAPVTASTTTMNGGWYVVNQDVEITSRITVKGTVNLILEDGKTLKASAGITTTGATLNIYGQSEDSGELVASVAEAGYDSGIGGIGREGENGDDGGTVTIHGGTVKATGGDGGAGIGGGQSYKKVSGAGGKITIMGGKVTAAGSYGAGIGGGYGCTASGDGGEITIRGGEVEASSDWGTGIGGGYCDQDGAAGGKITIEGGEVEAYGYEGAGIGGGHGNDNTGGVGGTITITGGTVEANSDAGAGIGGGTGYKHGGAGGSITIEGGEVTAVSNYGAAGIGGGQGNSTGGAGGKITIKDGTVTAVGFYGAGIGGGYGSDTGGDGGTITIEGGTVTAKGGEIDPYGDAPWGGAGIGGGQGDSTGGAGGTITITGGEVTAIGQDYAAGIGGGCGYYYDDEEEYADGNGGSGGIITIEGGVVKATGGTGAPGIGGGYGGYKGGDGANVTVSGANTEVTAEGGSQGCFGIGGGYAEDSSYNSAMGSLDVSSPLAVFGKDSGSDLSKITPDSDGGYARKDYMVIKKGHDHSFAYAADGASITATCSNEGCDLPDSKVTITLKAPQNLTYDGSKKAASIDGYPAEAVENLAAEPETITYYQSTGAGSTTFSGASLASAPVDAGNYVAQMTWGEKTASLGFTIAKAAQTIAADAVTVTYGDTDKSVSAAVTVPAAGGGTISYAVKEGSGDYIAVDSATGSLTVKKVPADGKAFVIATAAEISNYLKADKEVAITINKAESAVTTAPEAIEDLVYNENEQELVSEGATEDGTLKYAIAEGSSAPEDSDYRTSVPRAANAGTYSVWYKIFGDENHKDSEAVEIEATIEKAPAELSYEVPAFAMPPEGTHTNKLTNPLGLRVTYESSNTDIAEVDDAGEVYGKAVGKATVTAIADDPNYAGTASFEVTVSEHLAKIVGHSLTLDGGKIGINFIIDPDESDEDSLSTSILKDESWESVSLEEKTFGDADYLCFTVYVNAKEMTDSIGVELYGCGVLLDSDTYSVRDYYDAYMESGYADETTQALLEAMLTYGAMAQTYFDHNTDNLANKGVIVDIPSLPKKTAKTSGTVPRGLTIRGASLLLEEDISLRLYFDASEDLDSYSFRINGSKVWPQVSGKSANGQYYLETEHIQSYNLDKAVSFVFRSSTGYRTVSYSPLAYAYSVQRYSDDENLVNLVQAMYLYYQKAKAYVEA